MSLTEFIQQDSVIRSGIVIGIIASTIVVRTLVVKLLSRYIDKVSEEGHYDPTNYKFLKHAISALIITVGFTIAIYMIPPLRTLAHSMLAGAGILAIVIGFASQHAFANIISGVFIIIFKPFRVKDRLQVQDNIVGFVEDITLRHTVIRNFENKMVVIPNSIISQQVLINSHIIEPETCKIMDLGISYGSDINKAREIIQRVALAHPECIDRRTEEQIANNEHPVAVRVTGWGDFSINLRVWVWAKDPQTSFLMGTDLFEQIKKEFDLNEIEIPYPHRVVISK